MSYVIRVTTGEAFPFDLVGHQLSATTVVNADGRESRNPAFDNTLRLATPEEIAEIKIHGCVRINRPAIESVAKAPTPAPVQEFVPEHIPEPVAASDGEPDLEPAESVLARVVAMNEAELRERAKDLGIENADRTPEAALRGKVKKAELAARQPKAEAA